MTMVKTKTRVANITRNDLMQGVARRLLGIASDRGKNCEWYLERLEVMFKMELLDHLHLIIFKADKPIAGVKVRFDWGRHTALVEAEGEFIDPGKVGRFGTTENINDTIEAVRTYVDRLFDSCGASSVEVWYAACTERTKELGSERVDQLLDIQSSVESKKNTSDRWAKIVKAKADKVAQRVSTLGDLPETSFNFW